jgi:hypothetical protein
MARKSPKADLLIERLKLGPVTAAAIPEVKRIDTMICELRKKGWPILTEVRPCWDAFGVEHLRAEYRLGNWVELRLPLPS